MAELRRPPEESTPVDVADLRAAIVNASTFEELVAAAAAPGGTRFMSAARRRLLGLAQTDPGLARRLRAARPPTRLHDADTIARFRLAQHLRISDAIRKDNP